MITAMATPIFAPVLARPPKSQNITAPIAARKAAVRRNSIISLRKERHRMTSNIQKMTFKGLQSPSNEEDE
jgi:hypothetical protein